MDGGYTEWSNWSNCSKECGEGVQTRYRLCANPLPGSLGKDCYRFGPDKDNKPCFLKICPVDGKFGAWSSFTACNKPCGGGVRIRSRQCNNPPPVFGGKPCEGPTSEEEPCNTQVCPPIDGGYTQWSQFTPCTVSCGKGTMTRTRSCTNPPPSNGGKQCTEPASETVECDKGPCKPPEPAKSETSQNLPEQQAADAQKPEQVAQKPEQVAQKPEQVAENAQQAAQNSEGQAQQPQEQKQS